MIILLVLVAVAVLVGAGVAYLRWAYRWREPK